MFDWSRLRRVRDVQAALRLHLCRLVPGEVPLSDAPAMWEAFDGIERLAASAKTLLAQRVDESRAWARQGDPSAVDYLARKAGSSRGAARAALETSKRLRSLPATEAALRRGELSRPQVDTIADAAAVNPSAERSLLDTAKRSSLSELREHANRAKAASDSNPDATHRRIHRARRLRRFTDGEGAWNLHARGTADAGAAFNAALDPIIDEIFRAAHREGRHEPRDAYAFDAVLELARRVRGEDGQVAPASTPTPAGSPGAKKSTSTSPVTEAVGSVTPVPRTAPSNPRYLALLRVDLEALVRGRVDGDELCEITGVGPIPPRVARNLLGDAIVKLVITKGVDVANVTYLGRGPSAAQKVALLWRSPTCSNSLCSHAIAIQHDHRDPWAKVHETVLDNIDRLCPRCHRRKTHEGWALVQGTGRRPFVPPDHPEHPTHATGPPPRGDRSGSLTLDHAAGDAA